MISPVLALTAGSTIFKFRTAFPLLQAGGADVVLTNAVVPEADFLRAFLGNRRNLRRIARFPLLRHISDTTSAPHTSNRRST